jgi:hypothetical protein
LPGHGAPDRHPDLKWAFRLCGGFMMADRPAGIRPTATESRAGGISIASRMFGRRA